MSSFSHQRKLGFAALSLFVLIPLSAQAQSGPAPNWTGVYAGAHAGVGAGSIRGASATGGLIGGQVGFNAQADRIVLGVEGDLTSSGFEHKGFNGGGQNFKQKWTGTVRGRAGYALDQALVYGTLGLATASNELSDTSGRSDKTSVGFAVGAGAEFKLTERISARGEFLHYGLGTSTYRTPSTTYRVDSRTNVLRAGLNYRF